MEDEVTFLFQMGVLRDAVSAPTHLLTLAYLKEMAVNFVNEKIPDNGLNRLGDRLLLFRHDYCSPNVLQLINSASDVADETLVEIVLTANPVLCGGGDSVSECAAVARPHSLVVHSYKAPTFCDFCGEMLFGLVRQGLKCEGCGLDYHKRCAVKVPSDCTAPPLALGVSNGASGAGGAGGASGTRPARSPSRHSQEDSLLSSKAASRSPSRGSQCGSLSSWTGLTSNGSGHSPGIPHTFEVHSYTRPTVCRHCKKLLRGLFKQGFQCRDCLYNAHRKCLPSVPKDCGGELRDSHGEYPESSASSEVSEPRVDDSDDGDERRGEAPAPSGPASRPSSSSSSPSANIPLMRIVQSVKHTKRTDSAAAIKEGWLVHHTNKDKTLRRHYWRLDSKCLTLYQAETGGKFYREIPLQDIVCVDSARTQLNAAVQHCFEIRTANVDYLVGAECPLGATGGRTAGLGAHVARSWETALRHALMPHDAQATAPAQAADHVPQQDTDTDNSAESPGPQSPSSSSQAAPAGGGRAEMAQEYRIHPDEVLGSGQFGVVYGGLHRASERPVAIKVIDKLRFPTKQEAQLKNEVSILQNISHPGVVVLERMFESPERIFVVMEKLKGDMLEMILQHEGGRLSERTTKFLVAQILVALKHLHEKNIVHCDLKPENVLLSEHSRLPQVKLCDFGFARIIGEKSFRRSVVGTPAYLAPEVLRNKGYNRSLDMWSVGVIVYVSLSGTFPFNEDEDIADQIHNAAFMYPPQPWKEISADAIDLINNLLQVKQRKRLSVDKSMAHAWLQSPQAWLDLRALEARVGRRYLTHESDDQRYQ